MGVRLGYLGPPGTYSEEAASLYAETALEDAEMVSYASIPAVIEAAWNGEVEEAVVPIENSIEGVVTFTVDMLIYDCDLKMKAEVLVPIHHCLISDGDVEIGRAREVYSHPQALAQCRAYLRARLPNAEHLASLSTAAAIQDMRDSPRPAVAISSRRAAGLFDATIVESDVEDLINNRTRFVTLSRQDGARTGYDRTSICFDFAQDGPGILYHTLGELQKRDINMIKIESRPDKRSLGHYLFLIDMEGHRAEPRIRDALAGIQTRTALFKILGSYPRASG